MATHSTTVDAAPARASGAAAAATTARVYAEAQNRARDLQSTPANVATPSVLAGRAEEIAAHFAQPGGTVELRPAMWGGGDDQ